MELRQCMQGPRDPDAGQECGTTCEVANSGSEIAHTIETHRFQWCCALSHISLSASPAWRFVLTVLGCYGCLVTRTGKRPGSRLISAAAVAAREARPIFANAPLEPSFCVFRIGLTQDGRIMHCLMLLDLCRGQSDVRRPIERSRAGSSPGYVAESVGRYRSGAVSEPYQ